jgi:glycosyltransferase involved in cell wall biosynthesis
LDITIGIPAYNEEKNIASIIVKLKKIAQKIIVCNDGSTDLTGEIAEKLGAVVINHPKNLGYGSGIRSIFQKAKEIDSDILVTFDADGQHQVGDVGMGISTEILIKASSRGFKITEVPINIQYEGDTSTHNPVSHGTSVLLSTIKYISIEHPLKFYGIPSLIFFAIGLSFTFLSVQYYTEIGRLNTNLTLVAAGTVLIGIILIITTILLYSLVSVVREGKTR